jgi:hypothetical protein
MAAVEWGMRSLNQSNALGRLPHPNGGTWKDTVG